MFDIGWSEMAVILAVALIVIGPKDLPKVARTVGRWTAKGRALAREFQNSLEEMAREAELDKVKSEIERASRIDPRRSIENAIDPKGEIGRAMDPAATDSAGRTKPATAAPAVATPAAEPERAADATEEALRPAAPSAPAAEQRPAGSPVATGGAQAGTPSPRPAGEVPASNAAGGGERTAERRAPRPEPVD